MAERSKDARNQSAVPNDATLARLGGDPRLLKKLTQFFIEDSPELLQRIDAGIESQDCDKVAIAAHSLKGLAGNFDAEVCVSAAAEVERLARACDLAAVALRIEPLKQAVQVLKQQLQLLSGAAQSGSPNQSAAPTSRRNASANHV